jgi:hypothetical protein
MRLAHSPRLRIDASARLEVADGALGRRSRRSVAIRFVLARAVDLIFNSRRHRNAFDNLCASDTVCPHTSAGPSRGPPDVPRRVLSFSSID